MTDTNAPALTAEEIKTIKHAWCGPTMRGDFGKICDMALSWLDWLERYKAGERNGMREASAWVPEIYHPSNDAGNKAIIARIQANAYEAGFRTRTAQIEQERSRANPSAEAAPEGWQLVPKEPTFAMADAGDEQFKKYNGMIGTYKAMLAAAPKPPAST